MTNETTDVPEPDEPTAMTEETSPTETPEETTAGVSATPMSRGRIRRARARLTKDRDEALFHLGGLAHDLHRRGEINRAVLSRRCGVIDEIDEKIQLLDWRLETLERERRARKSGGPLETGHCVNCRTTFHAEAQFCARCGVPFAPSADPSGMTMEIEGLPTS